MLARLPLLILGVALLPGCGSRKGAVDPGVLAELTAAVNEPAPVKGNSSPYDARGIPPVKDDSTAMRTVKPEQEESEPPQPPTLIEPENPPTFSMSIPKESALSQPYLFPGSGKVPDLPPPLKANPAETRPAKPADPLVAAFACFREGKAEEGLKQLKKVDPATREMLAVLLPLAARLTEVCKSGGPHEYSSLLDTLDLLAQGLRPRSALTLEKMCFCRGIEKFGVYHPLPENHPFQAAIDNRPGELVRVYIELRNFASVKQGPFSETSLACTLEIHHKDKKGPRVWYQDRPAQTEQSRSPRRDLHLGCYFHVPRDLPPGDYTLWIHVKDVTGLSTDAVPPLHRIAGRSLPFHVRDTGLVRATDTTGD